MASSRPMIALPSPWLERFETLASISPEEGASLWKHGFLPNSTRTSIAEFAPHRSPTRNQFVRVLELSGSLDQPTFDRDGDGFGSAYGVQLGQDGFHMGLHRVFADVNHLADLLVALAGRHLLQNLELTLG